MKENINWLECIYEAIKALAPTPPVRLEVEDITAIQGKALDKLACGDQVVKISGNQKHLYTVSYKGDGVGEGICLTYVDASRVETVSYDLTSDGWAYNSTDLTPLG